MNTKNIVSEINIKDLFLFVIKKILIMIIVGSILGCALCSYRILQRMKTNDVLDASTKLNDSETDVQYELRVQNINKARVYAEMIDNIYTQIDHQKDYIANSIYMQIDAENVYQTNAQITVTLENSSFYGIDTVLFGAYERDVKAGNYLEEYSNKIGKKTDYVKELIGFSSTSTNNTIISIDSNVDRVGSMYFSVIGPSREFCDEVMNEIIKEVERVYEELNTSVSPHKISIVDIQRIQRIDSSIRDTQISHTGAINTLQSQISSYNEALDKVAKELGLKDKSVILDYFSNHPEVIVDGVPHETSEKSISRWKNIKTGIKYGLIGFFVGFALVFVYFSFCYIFGTKLSTQYQFFTFFSNLNNIGVRSPSVKRSKFCKFIDVRSGDDTSLSVEKNNKLILANYCNITRNYNSILITGTGDNKIMREVVEELHLKGDFKPDIFNYPDTLAAIPEYDAVVLIEQRNYSRFKIIDKEIDLICNSGTPIVGAILI